MSKATAGVTSILRDGTFPQRSASSVEVLSLQRYRESRRFSRKPTLTGPPPAAASNPQPLILTSLVIFHCPEQYIPA